jgi:hypothetical protein
MVHAALLLLMLEAVTKDLVFTISLKRSTQNLQLSTSWAGRLHHLLSSQQKLRERQRIPVRFAGPHTRRDSVSGITVLIESG